MAVTYKKTLAIYHKIPQTKKKRPTPTRTPMQVSNSKYVFIICVLPSQLSNLH